MAAVTDNQPVSMGILKAALDAKPSGGASGLTFAACKVSTVGASGAVYSTSEQDQLAGGDMSLPLTMNEDNTGFTLPSGVWIVMVSFARRLNDDIYNVGIEPFVLEAESADPTIVDVRGVTGESSCVDSWTIAIKLADVANPGGR